MLLRLSGLVSEPLDRKLSQRYLRNNTEEK
jgi:hypothetical protein